jgi:hypothetical protein
MLLVLDDFEHLLAGAILFTRHPGAGAAYHHPDHLRERLNLQAEWLFDVEGLSYPLEDLHGSLCRKAWRI